MSTAALSFSQFNTYHWAAVAQERKRQGLSRESECRRLPHHPLMHAQLESLVNGQRFTVTAVFQNWRRGWFTSAVLKGQQWDELVIVDAQNCHDPQVCQGHQAYLQGFRLCPAVV